MTPNTSASKNRPANVTQHNQQVEMDNPKLGFNAESKEMPNQMDAQAEKRTVQEKLDSYYADKDLAWWIELARDFKRATKVPLPEETEAGL
jgi:hypothetical protein